jgi:hypothetical protein
MKSSTNEENNKENINKTRQLKFKRKKKKR